MKIKINLTLSYVSTLISLVPRPLTAFQCCTLKSEREWPGDEAIILC